LFQRRETFIEKPEKQPEIARLGKRWEPPPDDVLPALLKRYGPISIQTEGPMAEHNWKPVVTDPEYRLEHKNFTPVHSPPDSPIHGYGWYSFFLASKMT
jgi:hypothetical protein